MFIVSDGSGFQRITTYPLVSKFFLNLDQQTDNLIKVISKKGGTAGRRIQTILAPMTKVCFANVKNITESQADVKILLTFLPDRSRVWLRWVMSFSIRWALWSHLNSRISLMLCRWVLIFWVVLTHSDLKVHFKKQSFLTKFTKTLCPWAPGEKAKSFYCKLLPLSSSLSVYKIIRFWNADAHHTGMKAKSTHM